eukprot:CAMPEP_0203928788 /NCGR_PEP_ID=MMETSP0359-20131031/67903_1 /ASSEMBLY_ACC=CAM_ASM_000338 /TAXON_ID=268821 /ORGANISM="Scrippsiella Hangoei, Strain SHTV-5" /LENGTH=189 /DNA_ID=CAMNT_0050857741 /DNA_START=257 /DNA_END=827 /DNA_ORIENTATION=+
MCHKPPEEAAAATRCGTIRFVRHILESQSSVGAERLHREGTVEPEPKDQEEEREAVHFPTRVPCNQVEPLGIHRICAEGMFERHSAVAPTIPTKRDWMAWATTGCNRMLKPRNHLRRQPADNSGTDGELLRAWQGEVVSKIELYSSKRHIKNPHECEGDLASSDCGGDGWMSAEIATPYKEGHRAPSAK